MPTVDLTESSTDESDTDMDEKVESMGEEDEVSDTFINHTVRDVIKASTDTADHSVNKLPLPVLAVNESVLGEDNAFEYNIKNIMSMINNEKR